MVRCSNGLVGLVNLATFIASFPVIAFGLWLKGHANSECERYLQWPFIILGLLLMFISLLGLFGSCCGINFFLWLYLFFMFVLIVALFAVTVFGVVVTNKGVGEAVSGKGYMDYKLGNYSHWLQKRVNNLENWNRIVCCLKEGNICEWMEINDSVTQNTKLQALQSGCCKPPKDCGFTKVNDSWKIPKVGLSSADGDCKAWSNERESLCYNCDSCKAGFLVGMMADWKSSAIFNTGLLVFLILIYSIGCCAFRNNQADHYQRYRGPYR